MPNMDGTGPRFAGQRMGKGLGRRGGAKRAFAGCRCGMGYYYPCAVDDKQTLNLRKEALQRSLDTIDKRLESL